MAVKLKILVVDDSAFMRLLITDLLSEDAQIEVIGTATNGFEAIEQVKELHPDIVLLDLNMAEYDGLYAVKGIMDERPTPILILSSVGNTDLQPIFEALKNGAVDYINKPDRNKSKMRELQKELIQKIKSASRAKPKKAVIKSKVKVVTPKKTRRKSSAYDLIAIGASTGGPTAIERVICSLPRDFDIPIIVCQHMPATFIPQFVQRLGGLTELEVVSATQGMEPTPGVVIFCPGHANSILTKSDKPVIDFTDEVYPEYNNPSINAMMLSAAKVFGKKMVGVLLTGMGKDGVNGMTAIHKAGGKTIAQNKESCVIYGMPKAAYEAGIVDEVIDIKDIGNYLVNDL